MADVNKSIEIQYRADIKQLLANLKKMPDVTSKEAKEMVSGLNKQLRQAEKAAARAAKTTSASFAKMDKAAKQVSVSARTVRKDFANIDRLTSEAGQALSVFSPALGDAAYQASILAGAVESGGRALMVSNPLFLAAAAAAGLAVFAYQEFTGASESAEKRTKEVSEALENEKRAFDNAAVAAQGAAEKLATITSNTNMLRNELLLMSGEISASTFFELQNDEQLLGLRKRLTDESSAQLDALKAQLAAKKAEHRILYDEYLLIKDSRKINEDRADFAKRVNEATRASNQAARETEAIEAEIAAHQDTSADEIENQIAARKEVLTQQKELKEEELRQAERDEQRKARLAAQRELLKKQKEEQRKLAELSNTISDVENQIFDLKNKNALATAKLVGPEEEIKVFKDIQLALINKQIEKAEELATTAAENATTDEQIAAAKQLEFATIEKIAELENQAHIAKMEAENKLQKLKDEGHKKQIKNSESLHKQELNTAHQLFNASSEFAIALGDLQKQEGKQGEAAAFRMFKFSQAAAVGDIAFSVAKGIAEAASLPPILRGAQIAAIVATGAAQTASVMAQQPPTADMGMIGNSDPLRPDERMVRVLKGESILDRATTAALGEDGVRALSSGASMQPQVIVMQPFKHFDRYIQRNQAGGGRLSQANSRIRY